MKEIAETFFTEEESSFLFDPFREQIIGTKIDLGNLCHDEALLYYEAAKRAKESDHIRAADFLLNWAKESDEYAKRLFTEFIELRLKTDNLTRQRIWGGV